jgi:hypothetical protein
MFKKPFNPQIMKKSLFIFAISILLFSCGNNYEMKDLYGNWNTDKISFTFNEDKSMSWKLGALEGEGRFRPFGNTLEVINKENKVVIPRISIRSLKGDTLKIDMPSMGTSREIVLVRAK